MWRKTIATSFYKPVDTWVLHNIKKKHIQYVLYDFWGLYNLLLNKPHQPYSIWVSVKIGYCLNPSKSHGLSSCCLLD